MKNKLVSLIIVNYNGLPITKKMVDSIYQNTFYLPFEIIIVDNASTDKSPEKLKKYLNNKDNALLFARKVNDFLTGGYNTGYEKSNGEILVFMNNDLVVTENWLSPLVKTLNQPMVAIAGSAMLSYQNKDKIDNLGCRRDWLGFGYRINTGKKFQPKNKIKEVDFVPGSLIAIKKNLFKNLGKFDEDYLGNYEDVDLAWRAKKEGYKSVITLNSVVYHLGSWTVDKEQKKPYSSYLCRKNRLMTMIKNASLIHLLIALPIYLVSQAILFFKELIIDRNFKLAVVSIKAIIWNAANIKVNLVKRIKFN